MSIKRIPDRYLNTTIHVYRESELPDEVGDMDVVRNIAYYSVKSYIQPVAGTEAASIVEFEHQGKVHRQTHSAYFNRYESDSLRKIEEGDYVLDEETGLNYIVLGIENWQSSNRNISDSHHIKLRLKSISGTFDVTTLKTVAAKAKIQ